MALEHPKLTVILKDCQQQDKADEECIKCTSSLDENRIQLDLQEMDACQS